ncbi:MAG: HPF/RaiA family ribosome-associated protein [Hydrogenophaga sp.]|uniref:HPF/RaiA family ribosome-associated protein n=1 Tax=unclassified Hydrogenophaga TaxID=2610897 RepID=UPI0010F4BA09|nr:MULTISPECIES: HPF/RaiA family ribosome-associated protein [unclassified Hydrogenophaga]MDP3251569.1 HPF/RaiA family ribosome-associated protein [Hydrogenophaga sp.]MDP3811648.1 HPF/RaiA family ribosome-associated protein [Hydrogenophaga sp.]MDZ4100146.1 HPF/RaiA family ribosome-associated protein [Hydrogenophaga sp.]
MHVLFESRDPEGAQLRELAVRRVRFVMRRLAWLVPRAKVQLSDINGPRGGVDKRCQVELKTDSSGTVVITSMARDWRSALEGALARAARALVRIWRRTHDHERSGQRAIGFDR